MRVQVKLFARAKDLAGADSAAVDLPEPAAVADLRRAVAEQHPKLAEMVKRCAVAVDAEFARDETKVSEGSEIALLPPVSGG